MFFLGLYTWAIGAIKEIFDLESVAPVIKLTVAAVIFIFMLIWQFIV
jgi:hypothetical protein